MLGKYECGQLFLHRVFGYRGVILFPWLARYYALSFLNLFHRLIEISVIYFRVYDRDQYQIKNNNEPEVKPETKLPIDNLESAPTTAHSDTNSRGKTQTFYQVLIDARDCPYIVSGRIMFLKYKPNHNTFSARPNGGCDLFRQSGI